MSGPMSGMAPDVLHAIGDTSMVALRRIAPSSGARIALKLESENPTGSMKDRMALAMVEAAEAMTDRLAREEALFAGTSTGANVVAALRVAEELPAGATVVTVLCDTGIKYLSRRDARRER